MGTNTGIGIGIGIPFKNFSSGGRQPLPPDLKASLKGVWIAYGKSNNDADRSIVKNLVDLDNPFIISNAAFKLNSGFGKYEVNFTSWIQTNGVIASSDKVQNSIIGRFLYFNTVNKKEDVPSFKVNITLGQQGKLQYNYIKEDGTSTYIVYSESGIYTIPASYFSKYTGGNAWFGFYQIEGTSIIEQIPSFKGAFVTDGIDDLITTTKTVQEMLGGSNEITVVSMAHFIKGESGAPKICRINQIRRETRSIRNSILEIGKSGIFGYTYKNGVTTINNILGDKNDCIAEGNLDGIVAPFSVEGYYYNNNSNPLELCSIAWYWTVIANKVLTTDQINQVIAYFNLDRTLNPDILCNITKQGITNDNHADFNDKLIDYSGNGRDIQMNNLAWKGGSGIAAKQYETFKDWTSEYSSTSIIKQIDEFTRIVESTTNGYWVSRIRRDSDLDKVYSPINVYLYQDNNFLVHECKYEVDGVKHVIPINEPVGKGYHKLEMYTKDRYTELPENAENVVLSEWYFPKSTKGSIKYSLIPSYKGGILLDGVNDFGKVTGMPIYKDYTIVVDYERISGVEQAWAEALISKSYIANQGAFVLMETNGMAKHSYSFGAHTTFNKDDSTRTLLYQSKYKCGDVGLNVGTRVDGDTLWLRTYRDNYSSFFNGVIYSLMSFPYSMSEFLIERQLKKYKLGTLYPDMVEFRPVIKSNVLLDAKPTFVIRGTSTYLNAGDYVPENSQIWVSIKMNNIADRITKFTVNGKTIDIPENAYSEVTLQYSFPFVIDKSPQKISITIEQDENYVLFNPVINSNYDNYKLTFHLREYEKLINIGDYIPKGTYIRANLYLKNDIDELVTFTFNGVNIDYAKSPVLDTAYNIRQIYNYDSPQEVNITVDEYIRYEDIVQPYPALLRFNDENGNEVSWGGKFKVGSTITRIGSAADSNLLPNIYNIFGLLLNGNQVTSSKVIVEKTMVFKAKSAYIFDNNEPKCILSPRLLRIPNSSYKILGYIPDISGHGNHGKINNSAYAGASGANGYLQNFSGWTKASGVSSTDSVISSSNNLVAANGWIAYVTSGTVVPTFKVEISGIPINGNLRFEGSGQTLVNGVNTIQGLTTTKISGFYISSGYDNDWSNLRIEQVGEYEGAYCLDGVDDFVTIPTVTGGKQVLMKVNWQSDVGAVTLYDQRLNISDYEFAIYNGTRDLDDNPVMAYQGRNNGQTYIDGILNSNIMASELKAITHNITITNELSLGINNTYPVIGSTRSNTHFAQMSLYDFMLFDGISTDDKIKELNEYVGIEGNTEWRKTE